MSSPDQGPLGVPLAIARDLIRDCIRRGSLRTDGRWIAAVITTVTGARVDRVAVRERRARDGPKAQRYADLTVPDEDAAAFQDFFPDAIKLRRASAPGTALFRIRG